MIENGGEFLTNYTRVENGGEHHAKPKIQSIGSTSVGTSTAVLNWQIN